MSLKKILIIDDEECVRQVLKIHLSGAGFEVLTVESASSGLRAAAGVDLLICDFQLPDMTGLDFLKAVATSIPVLFISGYLDESVMDTALESGAVEFLTKPFQKEELLSAVDRALLEEAG